MSLFPRAMVPLVAIGVGTWFGLGRPDAGGALAAGARAVASVTRAPKEPPSALVPALDRQRPTVDPNAIPDPARPLPRLNPDDSLERAWLVSEGPTHPPKDGRRLVTFTFDDGPNPDTAAAVLRTLSEHKIRAAFFLIGEYLVGHTRRAAESRQWAKRIVDEGHFVGNHTFDHKVLTGLSHTSALAEIDQSAAAIERTTGMRPWLFRPPYGALDPWLEGALRERQLELLLWNIDVQDMKRDDPGDIAQSLEEQLEYKQGGIVLLHDVHWPSVMAFRRLVRWLETRAWDPSHPEQRGWQIVDLAEYLRKTSERPQPFRTRDDLEHARRAASPDARSPER